MLTKLTFFFLMLSNFIVFSQEKQLDVNDFLGDWSIKKTNEHFPEIYLTRLDSKNGYKGYGVNFFIGKYTGKRRVQPFKKELKRRRCGNDNSYYFYNDFGYHDIWEYDPGAQILQVFNSKNNQEKKFEVNKISAAELILTRIK
ncbi:hypothetical protein [Aquimarina rubra]|uniref:Lipocalin-like domain-containing protein n=1 Tax=Aquimarina rubra TaxID=1920033 RepID=A0ABW5LC39_9FLAO